jgi:hypothetical protein
MGVATLKLREAERAMTQPTQTRCGTVVAACGPAETELTALFLLLVENEVVENEAAM